MCASACPVVAWAPAAHAAATRLASIGAAHEGAAPPVQGCCGISLLPLALVPGVPTVLCNGVRGLVSVLCFTDCFTQHSQAVMGVSGACLRSAQYVKMLRTARAGAAGQPVGQPGEGGSLHPSRGDSCAR